MTIKIPITLAAVVAALALFVTPALAAAPETPEVSSVEAPVHATEAVVHGVLNPGTLMEAPQSGTYRFLYKAGATCTGGSVTKPSGLSLGGAHEEPAEALKGLTSNTKYAVCLQATNLEGESTNSPAFPFTTALPPETPEGRPAGPVGTTTATLNGVLNPGNPGNPGSSEFLYKLSPTECEGESAIGSSTPALGGKKEAASAELTGLQPNAKYTFCLLAHNEAGEASAASAPHTLTTSPAPPEVASETATVVSATEAKLAAQINPNNEETEYTFEYSTSEAAGALTGTIVKVTTGLIPTAFGDQTASASTGAVLTPSTTYYYRVVAENAQSKLESKPVLFPEGSVQSFATVPTPSTDAVEKVTTTTATFNGHLTPLDATVATNDYFNYNLGPACAGGAATPTVDAGVGSGSVVAKPVFVQGLQPGEEYTVCFVTSNTSGSAEGAAVHFTTESSPPSVDSETNSAPTTTESTLEGTVNPNNNDTHAYFQYSSSSSVNGNGSLTGATATPAAPGTDLGAGFGDQSLPPAALTGLTPDKAYFYQVVAASTAGTTYGPVRSFSTLGPPIVTTTEAEHLTSFGAELEGTVYPGGLATTYHYAYVEAANYEPGAGNPYAKGSTTSEANAGPDSIVHLVAEEISGLKASTTYDYTLLASNELGEDVIGPNQSFTTLATPSIPPTALPAVVPPLPPPPGATFPLLGYPSIAQLDAKETQEDKMIPSLTITKSLTNAEKLGKALKACHKKKHAKQTKCEKQARSKYGKKGKK